MTMRVCVCVCVCMCVCVCTCVCVLLVVLIPGNQLRLLQDATNSDLWSVSCMFVVSNSISTMLILYNAGPLDGMTPYLRWGLLMSLLSATLAECESLVDTCGIFHFDWHASSAAWPLSVLQSRMSVFPFSAAALSSVVLAACLALSLILRFLNLSSLCSAVSEALRALSLSLLWRSLLALISADSELESIFEYTMKCCKSLH